MVRILSVMVLLPQYAMSEGWNVQKEEDVWRINLVPYYWGADVDLNVQLEDEQQHIRTDFLERSWVFQPHAVGLGFGAVRNNWGLLAEAETFASELDFDLPDGRPGSLDFEAQHVGIGLIYEGRLRVYEGSNLYFTPWLGLRYRHAGLRVVDDRPVDEQGPADSLEQSEDAHWVGPLAGVRVQWFLNPR